MNLNFKEIIMQNNLQKLLLQGNFGMEKENVRVTYDGKIACSEHPKAFKSKIDNPYITIDYAESQVEVITPTFSSMQKSYDFLTDLTTIVNQELTNECLWVNSMPPIINQKVKIGQFNNDEKGIKAMNYRSYLKDKYGLNKQLLSGVHFNFSFSDKFLQEIAFLFPEYSLKDLKNYLYLKIARNFYQDVATLINVTGNTNRWHESYCDHCGVKSDHHERYTTMFSSYRNSEHGYRNLQHYYLDYNSLSQYLSSVQKAIDEKKICDIREVYAPIRLKSKINQSLSTGVEYLEIRILDLNPNFYNGVNFKHLQLIHYYLIYCLLKDDYLLTEKKYINLIHKYNEQKFNQSLFFEMQLLFNDLQIPYDPEVFNFSELNCKLTDFIADTLQQSLNNQKIAKKKIGLSSYQGLELSTQLLIAAAIKRGVKVKLLDKQDNFIQLEQNGHIEYIKQGTKTAYDSYIAFLIMENKEVTKQILAANDVYVPQGKLWDNKQQAINNYKDWQQKAIVIKPKSTNFGLGITMLTNKYSYEDYVRAVDFAFSYDQAIIIEEYIAGKEYRLFVIGDEVVGILHREAAHVIGDGTSTIKQLIALENENYLRGENYVKPLQKIKLNDFEINFLKNQNLSPSSIISKGKKVYLRANSNISTGGVSLDFTDDVALKYQKIAVKAAKAVQASICGVDMIIPDIKDPNGTYGIIELNFNPAMHIHCYPYKGKNRHVPDKLLDFMNY